MIFYRAQLLLMMMMLLCVSACNAQNKTKIRSSIIIEDYSKGYVPSHVNYTFKDGSLQKITQSFDITHNTVQVHYFVNQAGFLTQIIRNSNRIIYDQNGDVRSESLKPSIWEVKKGKVILMEKGDLISEVDQMNFQKEYARLVDLLKKRE